MFDWWHWLIDTTPFVSPSSLVGLGTGWTTGLRNTMVAGTIAVWVANFAGAALLFLLGKFGNPGTFTTRRLRQLLFLFANMLFWAGVMQLMRAVIYYWPAYRLLATVNLLAAAAVWATVVFAAAIVLAQRRDPVQDTVADLKAEAAKLQVLVDRIRTELPDRLQKKLLEEGNDGK
mgnify:CR=1 FL=1